ncbi:MAG: S1 RNA-binding domain-containing protein [Chitinispirillaceae bacterium]|nr:S1 RNA-binding domain-containing protein [Chitinispirillaceae bacterium]
MIEFSKQIAERWNIPGNLAEMVCSAYVKGDSPYYLAEYQPEFCMELSLMTLWEIYGFLKEMDELSSKKKRVFNAYSKAKLLTPDLEKRINLTSNTFELDDLLIPVRPNPRSRGQIAVKKGLKPLADLILAQTEETVPVEELANEYVGKDPTLASVDDVISGVKDVMAEIIAYDETVRAMTREFAFEDGFFEVTPKNKKDPAFAQYIGRSVPVHELSNEELLRLFSAEEKKQIRLKLGVQLFRITELLRHHFIINPDATGFDCICETIDDSWLRLLQPIVERDVKSRFLEQALAKVSRQVTVELEKLYAAEAGRGPLLVIDASPARTVLFITVSGRGNLLGTTTEKKPADGTPVLSDRLKQFIGRYRAATIAVIDNDGAPFAESLIQMAYADMEPQPERIRYKNDGAAASRQCAWVNSEFESLLDVPMRQLYTDSLQLLKPVALLPKVGLDFYTVHPMQPCIPREHFLRIIDRIQTAIQMRTGVSIKEIADSPLARLSILSEKQILAIRKADTEGSINSKNDLLKVPGMSEVAFRNSAGFLLIPGAENLLDRTVVHPDFHAWFDDISEQLTVSIETLVTEPGYLSSYGTDEIEKKVFIERNLINQLMASRRFALQTATKVRRKLKLNEVKEGAIVSGRVTNITQFGVFVNINAVCDGLIHISQLADEYVETPEQVVSVNDRVDVRILKVDIKKRRISLSMRNLGTMAPKVRPSRGQLDNLAEFFKNR